MDSVAWIIYGALNLTSKEAGTLTCKELMDMWHGYIWRKREQENMLASLVTVWIANTAGKSLKKNLQLKDIFSDGRFKRKITDEDLQMYEELFGKGAR